MVQLHIEGFVEKPGVYEFPAGTPIGEALRKAKPKRFADLRAIDPILPLAESRELKIEPLQNLRIHVRGAVINPETIEVEPGTRICHIKQKIQLSDEADLVFFKKRNYVSDGDVILVPHK